MIKDMVLDLAHQDMAACEEILLKELSRFGISNRDDLKIGRHGAVDVHPDGREVFSWDSNALVEFLPIEMTQTLEPDGRTTIKLTRKFRLLFQP